MKHNLLLFVLCIGSHTLFGQNQIENINIRAHSEQNGLMFCNYVDSIGHAPGFEAPINSGNHTIFAFNFLVSGKVNDSIFAYGTKFLQGALDDSLKDRYGPIMDSIYYGTEDNLWNRTWFLTKDEVDNHITNFAELGYSMPEAIQNWPAHGDISKGQAPLLAPFVDINSNDIYEPQLGDYPIILGDQTLYSIYNGERYNDYKPAMGIETHTMVYTYNCNQEAYSNTVFAFVKHFNRSISNYEQAYLGYFSDFDIGNANDDWGFTDVDRATVYGVNADDFDELNGFGPGYDSIIPIQSATLLRGVIQDFDQSDNSYGINNNESFNGLGFGDGIVDNEYRGLDYSIRVNNNSTLIGDPFLSVEFYNNMSGYWKDGTQLTFGETGFIPPTEPPGLPSRFAYSHNDQNLYGTYGIIPGNSWYDDLSELPPLDIRMIGSSGPFTFNAGDSKEMYMAFVYALDEDNPDSSHVLMNSYIDIIKSDFENNMSPCGSMVLSLNQHNNLEKKSLHVYPNPFNDAISFNYEGSDVNAKIFIYDLMGREVAQKSISNGLNTIDLSDLVNTTYLLKLVDKEGIYTQKIIKR